MNFLAFNTWKLIKTLCFLKMYNSVKWHLTSIGSVKMLVLSQLKWNPGGWKGYIDSACFPEAWQVCVYLCLCVCVCGTLMGGLHMQFASGKCALSVAKMDSGCSQERWRGGGTERRAWGSVHLQSAPPGSIHQMSDELVYNEAKSLPVAYDS